MIPATIEGYRKLAADVLARELGGTKYPIADMIIIAVELIGRRMYEWEPKEEEKDG